MCVKEYDLTTNANDYLIVTEFLGTDLLTQLFNIDSKNYLSIIDLLCKALVKLHQLGVAHRDIKLENIMLTDKKEIKIIDFGHSIMKSDYNTNNYEIAGTALYMYPGLSRIYHPDFELLQKSDVWSLGIAIFMLLLKNYPYTICNHAESNDDKMIVKYMQEFMQFAKNPEQYGNNYKVEEFNHIMKQGDALFAEAKTRDLYTIDLRELLKGDPKNQKIYVPPSTSSSFTALPVTAETYTP